MEFEDGAFAKYINSVLGRFSVPKMQYSMNFLLKMNDEDPLKTRKASGSGLH